MDLKNVASLTFFLPEIIVSVTILLLIVLDLIAQSKRSLALIAVAGCAAALIATLDLYSAQPGWLFHRMIVLDNFSLFFKVFALAATILCIWMSLGSNEIKQVHQGEYYTLLLTCALGMFFMASSSNLLMAYLSLELVSLTSYVLTGFLPRNRRSSEAALKYLIYGGVASGTMIYGMSWVFGMTGSLDYGAIKPRSAERSITKRRCSWPLSSSWPASATRSSSCRFTCGRQMSIRARRRLSPRFYRWLPMLPAWRS